MATVRELGAAIAAHPERVTAVFLGFDLWIDVMATGKVGSRLYKKGGVPASDIEPEGIVTVPLPTIGRGIVIGVDITLPPDGYRIVS